MHLKTDIATVKKVLVTSGMIALVSGAFMAFAFGREMSYLHAVTLALLSVVAAFMPTMIDHLRKSGRTPTAAVLGLLCTIFIGAEYFSHLGYTIGHRVRDTEETGVQNIKYSDTREQVADHRKNLAMWQAQLAKLQTDNAWAATVRADGLRAELIPMGKAIELETARGGCKSKCQGLMVQKAEIEKRIGIAEQSSDLAKRIEATQRLVDNSREKAASTEHRSSRIVSQTKFVGQLWTASLEPNAEAMNWTQIGIGALIALVTTFLAPVCFFMAFGDQPAGPAQPAIRVPPSQPFRQPQPIAQAPAPQIIERTTIIDDERFRRFHERYQASLAAKGLVGA
jgi:hypothetical protein